MTNILYWLLSICIGATGLGLLLSRNWRTSLGLLSLQYLAAFVFILDHWLLNMSASILISGWMACAALGMTFLSVLNDPSEEQSWPQGGLFRIIAANLVLITVSAASSSSITWLPNASPQLIWSAFTLIGLGLLHLGMTLLPFRVIIGLLSTLLGFEMLYSTIENSILVAGLLVLVTLGLAMTGCYLLVMGEQPA